MTLIFVLADMPVGATVAPSIGSIISASSGFCAADALHQPARVGAVGADRAQERVQLGQVARRAASCGSIRSSTGISLRSALSDAPGTEAWPLLPRVVTAKAEHCFSPTPTV